MRTRSITVTLSVMAVVAHAAPIRRAEEYSITSNNCIAFGQQGLAEYDTGLYTSPQGYRYDNFLSFLQDCLAQGGPDGMQQGPASSQCGSSAEPQQAPQSSQSQPADQSSSSPAPSEAQSAPSSDSQPAPPSDANASPSDANSNNNTSAPESQPAPSSDANASPAPADSNANAQPESASSSSDQPTQSSDANASPASTNSNDDNNNNSNVPSSNEPSSANDEQQNSTEQTPNAQQSNGEQQASTNDQQSPTNNQQSEQGDASSIHPACHDNILCVTDDTVRPDGDDVFTYTGVNSHGVENEESYKIGEFEENVAYKQGF